MSEDKWFYRLWFVIAMLFVAGPFAFPLLWKSPRISFSLKWILTVLIIILTVVALWLSLETGKAVWKEIQSLQSVLY